VGSAIASAASADARDGDSAQRWATPDAFDASNLLSGMERSPLRYLSPDDRDPFAVYESAG
jgi:hypothetical protein